MWTRAGRGPTRLLLLFLALTLAGSALHSAFAQDIEGGSLGGSSPLFGTSSIGASGINSTMDSLGYQFGPHEALVFTSPQLRDALLSPTVTDIYLGDDITVNTLSSSGTTVAPGIVISPDKGYLIIDGISPDDPQGKIHTLTEYHSSGYDDPISLRSNTGLKEITLRNLVIQGKNYYGTVMVGNECMNVSIAYENIVYNGPQLTYNRYGSARYQDCQITIGRFGGASDPGEVGEVREAEFMGRVDISQGENQGNEIFFVDTGPGAITFRPGSHVTVSTFRDSGFLYSHAASKTKIVVEENARFHYTAPLRFWDNYMVDAVQVKSGGEMIVELTGPMPQAALHVESALTVEEGATFHLISHESNSGVCLLGLRMGAEVSVTDPRSFLLYDQQKRTMQWAEQEGALHITGQQVNYWNAAADYPGTGEFARAPLYGWRKADDSVFSIDAIASIGATAIFKDISSNYKDGDLPGEAPTTATFNPNTSRVIAAGRLPLDAQFRFYTETDGQIVGTTEPYASVRIFYEDDRGERVWLAQGLAADEEGDFALDIDWDLPDDLTIFVEAERWFRREVAEVGSRTPMLHFGARPRDIDFPITPLSPHQQTIAQEDEGWGIHIVDNRGAGATWRLWARLEEPLGPVGDTNAPPQIGELLFRDAAGRLHDLTPDGDVLIRSHTNTGEESYTVMWQGDEGILALIEPGAAYAGVPYQGTVLWTLSDAP